MFARARRGRLRLTHQLSDRCSDTRRERVADPREGARDGKDQVRAVRRHPGAPPALRRPERHLADLVVRVLIPSAVARDRWDHAEADLEPDQVGDGKVTGSSQWAVAGADQVAERHALALDELHILAHERQLAADRGEAAADRVDGGAQIGVVAYHWRDRPGRAGLLLLATWRVGDGRRAAAGGR